ncbi:hypothetical protein C8J57DRAFT_1240554 [Mycena rebaudengoi]|nr:hypothetical protein C8J57DRAFT_1240554 [Mycena rebaudengoi]
MAKVHTEARTRWPPSMGGLGVLPPRTGYKGTPQDPGWAGKAVVHVITKKTRANRKVKASEEGPSVGIRSTGEAEDADAEIVVETASRAQGKAEAKRFCDILGTFENRLGDL